MKEAAILIVVMMAMGLQGGPARASHPTDMDNTGDANMPDVSVVQPDGQPRTQQAHLSDMVLIPGGSFEMGDGFSEGWAEERPVRMVTLDAFYIGRHEVTHRQYGEFLNWANAQGLITVAEGVVCKAGVWPRHHYCSTVTAHPYSQILYRDGVFSVRAKGARSMADDPVTCVTWYGAAAYCNWLSGRLGKQPCYDSTTLLPIYPLPNGVRLPTEAQWEYAARDGLVGKRFPWGDTITHSQANYYSATDYDYDRSPTRTFHPAWDDGIRPFTSPVGGFPANGYGLHDVAGNVREWCNDWYLDSYYRSGPSENPTGPSSGTARIVRGGAWGDSAFDVRVARRKHDVPHLRYGNNGFRIAMNAE